jgi:uncharacterized protein (TIGR02646 family)
MRYLPRKSISKAARTWLQAKTQEINALPDQSAKKARAEQLWDSTSNNSNRTEIRKVLESMASGLTRCMYCESNFGTDIDHFAPKTDYPESAFAWKNFLLACSYCNSNQKRTQFPLDPTSNAPLLIDPSAEDPMEHLTLTPKTGEYRPKKASLKGVETIRVFGLNTRTELVGGRSNAWKGLQSLVEKYGRHRGLGDEREARRLKKTICEYPFSAVFLYFLKFAERQDAARFIGDECVQVLTLYPEMKQW